MLLPSSVYTNTVAQDGNPVHENHNNKTNVQINTTTKPEVNTPLQLDSEQGLGAPEISRQRQPFATLWFKLVVLICILILIVYAGGCAVMRLNRYSIQDKEFLFRQDCNAAGARIEARHYHVPGWGVGWLDCLHGEVEGEGKRNSTLEMVHGQVFCGVEGGSCCLFGLRL
jgi:hypothetical protein